MSMTVAVIDYGSGNLRSAQKALERAASDADLSCSVLVTDKPEEAAAASRIVLPGVGAFGDCRDGLYAVDGMVDAIVEAVKTRGIPFLGICVGMQLMAGVGREHGDHAGLGWIDGEVVMLEPSDPHLKIPHMGWNRLDISHTDHPVLSGLDTAYDDPHAYFLHSYWMRTDDPDAVLASADYGGTVTAAVGKDNLIGTQFHPEKSQAVGLHLLRNFLTWTP